MSTAVARNLMAEMKLLGMFESFDRLVTEATREQWSCTDFLDAILQAENDFRSERKTKRRIKAAKFALRPSFEDFDFTANRSITKTQIKDLYSLHWLADARPVLLIGQTGVGKTFLAQALGLHACAKGKAVLYMTFTTWLENLALARSAGTYLKFRDKCAKPDAIILDDFGMRKLTATEAQDLCELLEERSIDKSTVFTTQLPVGSLGRGHRRSGHSRCGARPPGTRRLDNHDHRRELSRGQSPGNLPPRRKPSNHPSRRHPPVTHARWVQSLEIGWVLTRKSCSMELARSCA